jgi:hypothetical protein
MTYSNLLILQSRSIPSYNASTEHCVPAVVDKICFACSEQARSLSNDLDDNRGSLLFFLH